MLVRGIAIESFQSSVRASAEVTWEDCDRPAQTIYFETTQEHFTQLKPEAFLVACCMPAMHYREARLKLDEEVCPELQTNLQVAMQLVQHWFPYRKYDVPHLDVKTRTFEAAKPFHTSWFCSGGIDSLATLCLNRKKFDRRHDGAVQSGIFIYGFDFGKRPWQDERPEWNLVRQKLEQLAAQQNIALMPVITNIRQAFDTPDIYFWRESFSGAALAAVAHFLGNQVSQVLMASGSHLGELVPLAQHPLLNTYYSSFGTRIRYDGIHLSRFEKIKLIAPELERFPVVRVCTNASLLNGDAVNCGRCEKCLRTMTALVALNRLKNSHHFPVDDVTPELLQKHVVARSQHMAGCYQDLIDPLTNVGRYDLVDALQQMLVRSRLTRFKIQVKQQLKQFTGTSKTFGHPVDRSREAALTP